LEEPKEPPSCRVRVLGGASAIEKVLDDIKKQVYKYNSEVSKKGYYLKPVHKVYKKLSNGRMRIYEYYGRYWWRLERRNGKLKWIYVSNIKPKGLPEFPSHKLEGVVVIREGNDIIIDCEVFDRLKELFENLPVERYY